MGRSLRHTRKNKIVTKARKHVFGSRVGLLTHLITQRPFSTMRRGKPYFRPTERLVALALMHAYRDMPIVVEAVIREFCANKNRSLVLEFLWVPPRFQICLQLVSLVMTLWLHFVKYSVISLVNMESWHLPINLSTQIAPDCISNIWIFRIFRIFREGKSPDPPRISPLCLLMGANVPILYLPSICSTKGYQQKTPRNTPDNDALHTSFTQIFKFLTGNKIHQYSTLTRYSDFHRWHSCRTNIKKFSILFQDPRIWNSWPNNIRNVPNSNMSKRVIKPFSRFKQDTI